MLFLQFILYSSSFVGALKNEIPEAALELCQLKIKQLSPDILKFRTKHEDNPFTFNCSVVSRSFLFVFHAGSRGLGSNNSRNSSYKEKTAGSAHVSRLFFRFLWLWLHAFRRVLHFIDLAIMQLVWWPTYPTIHEIKQFYLPNVPPVWQAKSRSRWSSLIINIIW